MDMKAWIDFPKGSPGARLFNIQNQVAGRRWLGIIPAPTLGAKLSIVGSRAVEGRTYISCIYNSLPYFIISSLIFLLSLYGPLVYIIKFKLSSGQIVTTLAPIRSRRLYLNFLLGITNNDVDNSSRTRF